MTTGEQRQSVIEPFAPDRERKATVGGRVEAQLEQALNVRRPAFVEPKVICVGVSGKEGACAR